jgi:protein O-mannosyl-transferase
MPAARSGPVAPFEAAETPAAGLLPFVPLGLLVLIALAYAQVRAFGFVNVDDQSYVYENPLVRQGLTWAGVVQAFTRFQAANWHPLTWLSHQFDVQLFGLDAGAHHLVNVVIHALDTLLLYALVRQLTARPWRSALVAALFAIHPLHVESVAWISERKDVLSTLFLLLTLLTWVDHVRQPRTSKYLLALGLFVLGLLCKPMLVTLPVLLLLLDWWPLGRPVSAATLLEKVPFALLAAASSVVTLLAQASGGAAASLAAIPPFGRVANAIVSAALYLWKAAWPARLAAIYPHPLLSGVGLPAWQVVLSAAVLAGLGLLAWRERVRRPWLAFGLAWYLATLLPVIGLVQVGMQAMADRYTYVPLIGPFLAVAWAGAELLERGSVRGAAAWLIGGIPVLALTVGTWNQVATWRDSVTLHRHALAVTERNWIAWVGLGDALSEAGEPEEAIPAYRNALEIRADEAQAWGGLGVALGRLGRPAEAIEPLRQAVRLNPELGEAWYNLGVALGGLGQHAESRDASERAVAIRPDDARAWGNLGLASLLTGDRARAVTCLERLERLDRVRAAKLAAQIDGAP